jgi:hypothetical protein
VYYGETTNWNKEEYTVYSGEDDNLLVCFSFKFDRPNEPNKMSYNAVIACSQFDNVLTIKRAIGIFQNKIHTNQDEWFYGNDIVSTNLNSHVLQRSAYKELIRMFPNTTIVADCQNDRIEESVFYKIIIWMSDKSEEIEQHLVTLQ